MKKEFDYYVVEDVRDFDNYQILGIEEYKEGVVRVAIVKDLKEYKQFKKVFCKTCYLPKNIDSHNCYWASQ